MKTFKELLLNESIKNYFNSKEKAEVVDELWELLVYSYNKAGGLKGNGFKSKEDMIKNIAMWKLIYSNNKLVACLLYKDKEGRKLVAFGAYKDGLILLKSSIKESFKNSFVEISGPALKFIENKLKAEYMKYRIPSEEAVKILKIPSTEYNIIDNYFYEREIGGEKHMKVMLGTPNIKIV